MEKYGMGDVRQSRKKWDAAENQPLTAREKAVNSRYMEVYAAMLDKKAGTLRGKMTTAVPLPADKQKNIKAHLEKISGKRIILDFNVDQNILGGLILKVEDRVLDGSLKAQINILKDQIKRGE